MYHSFAITSDSHTLKPSLLSEFGVEIFQHSRLYLACIRSSWSERCSWQGNIKSKVARGVEQFS